MKSIEEPTYHGTGVTWAVIGVIVMTAGAVALIRLDGGITGILVGAALGICLAMVAVMLWTDRKAARNTERLLQSRSPRR